MQIIKDDGQVVTVRDLSLDDWRRFMAEFMTKNSNSSSAWDLMGCIRGPDSPSENPSMTSKESSEAYAGRRKRKFQTIEIIRNHMFFGVVGGCARSHNDNKVTLPSPHRYDHFDRHVQKAARILGLRIQNEGE